MYIDQMLADGYITHSYGNDSDPARPRDPFPPAGCEKTLQVPAENFLQAAPGWKWGDHGDPRRGKALTSLLNMAQSK